jgi:hydroxypyruvate isomerase
MAGMKHAHTLSGLEADLRELEASADRAGLALACAFSSAAEFEADVIRARREARLIGSRHVAQMRGVLVVTATTALAVLLLIVA